MSGNIYIFWKELSDPPAPWTRLTQQGKYIRFTDTAAYHLAVVGAATHDHNDSVSTFSIGNCAAWVKSDPVGDEYHTQGVHGHSNPSSYAISSANNDPAYYGLDIIYMDFTAWKAYEKSFPDGSVVLSSQELVTGDSLGRFSAADGKYILNSSPAAIGGSIGSRSHTVAATSGTMVSNSIWGSAAGAALLHDAGHIHSISLNSSGNTNEPRTLTTRLYEILSSTLKARSGMVAFCDGTPDADWEILSAWSGANLKSGDSEPTLSGSDTHAETVAGNTSISDQINARASTSGIADAVHANHVHPVTGTLQSVSHVPSSLLLMPIKLKVTYSSSTPRAQLIGPLW